MSNQWNECRQKGLEYCESEPLAYSNAIQPHGGLLNLDSDYNVTHASANLTHYLPHLPANLLSRPLPEDLKTILTPALNRLPKMPGSRTELFAVAINNHPRMDFVISRGLDNVVIEIFIHDTHPSKLPAYNVPMKTPSNTESALELHNKIASLLQDLTDFDRVMVYAFREDGDGEVLAEARRTEKYGSYLGLRFPASDIPLIARNLYKKNPWRLIPDRSVQPIPILSHSDTPPDLNWSDLRSVSPIHQIYLANMGVRASFSLPIMAGSELWGLIACHHATPHSLTLKTMRSASQISRHYALVISTWLAETGMRFVDKLDIFYQEQRLAMLKHGDIISAIPDIVPNLFELFSASGLAIKLGNVWAHTGDTPNLSQLTILSDSFDCVENDSIQVINSFSLDYPQLEYSPVAGAQAIKLLTHKNDSLQIWLFRKELIQEVQWGGNPNKPVEFHDGKMGIAPRQSFDKWVEKRKGYCSPWKPEDRLAAKRLRQLLIELYG